MLRLSVVHRDATATRAATAGGGSGSDASSSIPTTRTGQPTDCTDRMDVTHWLLTALLAALIREYRSHSHSHGHVNPEDRPTGFHDPKVVHDTEHIKEHYEGQAKLDESEMTPEELEFHYFKLHDYDNNTKLDGLEILKALTHLVPYQPETEKPRGDEGASAEQKLKKEKEEELQYYMDIVDTVLEEDDIDNDGYLTYAEYVLARKREEAKRDEEARKNPNKDRQTL